MAKFDSVTVKVEGKEIVKTMKELNKNIKILIKKLEKAEDLNA